MVKQLTDNSSKLWRIGIWCAVSTKPQAAPDKESLPEQERLGRQFAEDVGGEIVAVYRVPGHTRDLWRWDEAESLMPAYRQLREGIEAGKLDVLYCVDSDRLGRDPALVQQVISLVERNGAEVYRESRAHTLGKKSESDRYIDAFDSVSASQEQKRRKRQLRMGMKGRIEKRGMLAGTVPFYLEPVREPTTGTVVGYQFNDQVAALDLMTQLFLAGHPYAKICRQMDDSRFPPPGNSKRWWHATIRKTLRSDVPAGIPSWGPFRAKERSDKFPARWDEETYQAVLRERQRRARFGYHRRGSSPLSKVAFCARCGGGMTRHLSQRMPYYYLRCNRHASISVYPHYECHPNHIAEPKAVEELAKFLEWLTDDAALDQVLAEQGDSAEVEEMRRELARARSAVEDLEARKLRAGHAFARDDMEISVYRQVNADLNDELDTERATAGKLAELLEAVPDLDERRCALKELAEGFPELLETREAPEIATLLQQAGIRVLVEEGKVQSIRLD